MPWVISSVFFISSWILLQLIEISFKIAPYHDILTQACIQDHMCLSDSLQL